MFHKIVVVYDDSPEADRALDVAIELTRALQAELRIVTVLEPLPNYFSWMFLLCRLSNGLNARGPNIHCIKPPLGKKRMPLASRSNWLMGMELTESSSPLRKITQILLVVGLRQDTLLIEQPAKKIAERSPCALLGVR
jgi:Universal stress protein family